MSGDLPGSLPAGTAAPAPSPELAAARAALTGAGYSAQEIANVEAGLGRHGAAPGEDALVDGLSSRDAGLVQGLRNMGVPEERIAAALGHNPTESEASGAPAEPSQPDVSEYMREAPDYSQHARELSPADLHTLHTEGAEFAAAVGLPVANFKPLMERVAAAANEIGSIPEDQRQAWKAERIGLLQRAFASYPGGLRGAAAHVDIVLVAAQKTALAAHLAGEDATSIGFSLDPALLHILADAGRRMSTRQRR